MSPTSPIVKLGTRTPWGKIASVGIIQGERYYWMVDKHGSVAMIPADAVEPTLSALAEAVKRKATGSAKP